jgi:hypothetical protein
MLKNNLNWNLRESYVKTGTLSTRDSLNILMRATVDDDLAQRIFVDWDDERKQSYIESLFQGTNLTSVFVLADLKSITTGIKTDIELVKEQLLNDEVEKEDAEEELESLNDNLEYFQSLIDDGYDYLLLDGKHRSELLRETFLDKTFKFGDNFKNYLTTNKVGVNLKGRSLKNFDESLTEYLLDNTKTLMTVIRNGKIEDMQGIFVKTNSGLQLFPMELRICTMSVLARFVRDLTNPNENHTIYTFFKSLKGLSGKGTKSFEKKGHLLLLTYVIAYYMNNIKTNKSSIKKFYSDKYFDSMYEYSYKFSKSDQTFIREVFHILSKGSLEEYKKAKSNKNPKYIGLTWADTQNVVLFMMLLLSGKTNELKSLGKSVDVIKDKEQQFFRKIFDLMIKRSGTDLFELDSDGNKLPRMDKYGTPMLNKKGDVIHIENEHSFKRKNRNNTEENQSAKLNMLEEYSQETKFINELVDEKIVVLVDNKRTLSRDEKRYQAIVEQNSFDAFDDSELTLGDIDSGLTANSHVEAHVKGGSKMVVGNAKANLKSKTDTIYSAI